jgi:biopolymer transport protein ExbD
MNLSRARSSSAEIPTASMADISFLLIIFFMVTTVFSSTRGLDFELPVEEEPGGKVEAVEAVYIQILPDGGLRVDGSPMPLSGLLDYLEPRLAPGQGNPDKPVIIRPSPETLYAALIDVCDELRLADRKRAFEVRNVSIPTQREIDEYVKKFGVNPFDL